MRGRFIEDTLGRGEWVLSLSAWRCCLLLPGHGVSKGVTRTWKVRITVELVELLGELFATMPKPREC